MKYSIVFLLVVFMACSDNEPVPCEVVPEPFSFKVVDQSGNNRLTANDRPANTRIFYLRNNTEISLELEFRGSDEETYGVSGVLPLLSAGSNVDTYYLERGSATDTLLVRVSEQVPGNNCEGYSYDAVTFNGAPAEYDTTAEPPVYVLLE